MKEWIITVLIFVLLRVLESAIKRWNKRAADTVQKWDDKVSQVLLDVIEAVKAFLSFKKRK